MLIAVVDHFGATATDSLRGSSSGFPSAGKKSLTKSWHRFNLIAEMNFAQCFNLHHSALPLH